MEGLTYERHPTHFLIRDATGRVVVRIISDRSDEDVMATLEALNVRPYPPANPEDSDDL
jgi:hypothetical protein